MLPLNVHGACVVYSALQGSNNTFSVTVTAPGHEMYGRDGGVPRKKLPLSLLYQSGGFRSRGRKTSSNWFKINEYVGFLQLGSL